MRKFQRGDKIKIVRHSKSCYCGLNGKISNIREKVSPKNYRSCHPMVKSRPPVSSGSTMFG